MKINNSKWTHWLRQNGYRVAWTAILCLGTAAVTVYSYPCLAGREACTGGTLRGITLGFIGAAAIAFSMIYSLRKDRPRFSFLPLKHWLYGHVVIGTLSLYLITMHSGFSLRNVMAVVAYAFLILTVLSGVVGMALFYYLPRLQTRHEASVLIPDDLCQRLTRLHEEMSTQCSQKGGVFLDLYNELVIPIYQTRVGKEPPNPDVSPWAERAAAEDQEEFVQLAVKIEGAHDLMVLLGQNMRFRWLIRGWVVLHYPATLGLIVFSVVHVVSITWYGVP